MEHTKTFESTKGKHKSGYTGNIANRKDSINTNKIKFIRFDSTTKGKEIEYFGKEPGDTFLAGKFHTPPSNRGVYAFPKGFVELFLVYWRPDSKNLKKFEIDWDGDVWHHLSTKLKGIKVLDEHGAWIKTSLEDYCKCLKRENANMTAFAKKNNMWYSKDHMEVFLETKGGKKLVN